MNINIKEIVVLASGELIKRYQDFLDGKIKLERFLKLLCPYCYHLINDCSICPIREDNKDCYSGTYKNIIRVKARLSRKLAFNAVNLHNDLEELKAELIKRIAYHEDLIEKYQGDK